jgi:hypothetical protein
MSSCLPDCRVYVSMYPGGPTTSHLDTRLPGFPLVFKQMLRWFPRSKLVWRASHVVLPIQIL